ncbi:ribonuclease H-like domain-containing protein [Mesorhizobium sp. M0976]
MPVHELLPIEQDQGLTRLPAPSLGDIFLDLEGDPFARDGGREYLFGLLVPDARGAVVYRSQWAFSDGEERTAFQTVVDEILRCWEAHPTMHVYHYAPYESRAPSSD